MTGPNPDSASPGLDAIFADPEIAQFIQGLGVRQAENIGTLAGEHLVKRCYLLHLSDATKVKLRRLRSADRAREVESLLATAAHPSFPKPLARQGPLLLEPWIEGSPVDARSPDIAARCGSLLGEFHARTPLEDRFGHPVGLAKEQMEYLVQAGDRLLASEEISGKAHQVLVTTAQRLQPTEAAQGIIHGDLAPENIVIDESGRLVVIDNDQVLSHPFDYDLARAWIRWPMTGVMKMRFLDAYRRHRDPTPFQISVHFWLLCALTRAAAFRVENAVVGRNVHLYHLRRLLGTANENRRTLLYTWNSGL